MDLRDEGYETVRILNEDGTVACEKTIDLWEMQNHLAEINRKTQGQPAYVFHQAVVDMLVEKGFPPVSHRFADAFVGKMNARIGELKNSPAGVASPGSPASTASIPSDSAPPSA